MPLTCSSRVMLTCVLISAMCSLGDRSARMPATRRLPRPFKACTQSSTTSMAVHACYCIALWPAAPMQQLVKLPWPYPHASACPHNLHVTCPCLVIVEAGRSLQFDCEPHVSCTLPVIPVHCSCGRLLQGINEGCICPAGHIDD